MKKDQKKRKNKSRPECPLPLKWEFGPNIPTSDFFEGRRPEDHLGEAMESFIFTMEQDEFLAWDLSWFTSRAARGAHLTCWPCAGPANWAFKCAEQHYRFASAARNGIAWWPMENASRGSGSWPA